MKANFELGPDLEGALNKAAEQEESPLGKQVLNQLGQNAAVARSDRIPLCQDCGIAIFFIEMGQDVHIRGSNLAEAITEGVGEAYTSGYLRKSVASRPFSERVNTGDNTPPIIHTEIVSGDRLRISMMPKGGGAENMSRLVMLRPGEGAAAIIRQVVETVKEAGGKPCPPLIIGLGIGGTMEKAALMSKKALLRPVGSPAKDPETAALEAEILEKVNGLGIGPLGMGGTTTALAVHASVYPCHITSLPVAINLQCHSARHAEVVL